MERLKRVSQALQFHSLTGNGGMGEGTLSASEEGKGRSPFSSINKCAPTEGNLLQGFTGHADGDCATRIAVSQVRDPTGELRLVASQVRESGPGVPILIWTIASGR